MTGFGSETCPLSIPECEHGIGDVILSPDSAKLIDGVKVNHFPLWPDDGGSFLEVVRIGKGLPASFNPATTQVSAALSYPNTIKAFHYHLEQTDFWVPAHGMLQVVLVDL